MLKKLFSGTLYVKVYANKFVIRHIEDQHEIVLSASEAFTTKRLLAGEYMKAEKLLKEGFAKIHQARWFSPAPAVVIQPMEMTENGLSAVEDRLFHELAHAAGARKVVVWVGHVLSDTEVGMKLKAHNK